MPYIMRKYTCDISQKDIRNKRTRYWYYKLKTNKIFIDTNLNNIKYYQYQHRINLLYLIYQSLFYHQRKLLFI